jgi:hypothetical protein
MQQATGTALSRCLQEEASAIAAAAARLDSGQVEAALALLMYSVILMTCEASIYSLPCKSSDSVRLRPAFMHQAKQETHWLLLVKCFHRCLVEVANISPDMTKVMTLRFISN